MAHSLGETVSLENAFLQVDDVGMLALDTAQGPEFPQGQLNILRGVTADLLHSHTSTSLPYSCLVYHTVTAPAHLLDKLVLGLTAHHPLLPHLYCVEESHNTQYTMNGVTIVFGRNSNDN